LVCSLAVAEGPDGDCGFLAANFCAHSIFGEDALANVSIEKSNPADESSPIVGHIRIRAKSQGMALTLGDKVSSLHPPSSNSSDQCGPAREEICLATGADADRGSLNLEEHLYVAKQCRTLFYVIFMETRSRGFSGVGVMIKYV